MIAADDDTEKSMMDMARAERACQRCAVVYRGCRAAQDVAPTVDEHHYRQRLGGWLFGCDDVEGETVLAAGLVPADAHHGVAALLRSTVGKRVAVPYARPGLRWLRRPESQRAHRRPGVRD